MSRKEFERHEFIGEDELTEKERNLVYLLEEYDVEFPSESQMNGTIDVLRPYVPAKKKRFFLYKKMYSALQSASREFVHISLFFWLSNSLLFMAGLSAVFLKESNPYFSVMFLAPIPFIIGLIEVLKSRNENMAELEATFKHSLQEIILSKMVVVGAFNLFLNIIFTLIVPIFADDIWIWKLILYWLTPFTVMSALTFLIASRLRNSYVMVSVSLTIWAAVSYGIILSELATHWIESIHVLYYIALNVFAIAALSVQISRFRNRGVDFEFDH